jgi:hypothetical protein
VVSGVTVVTNACAFYHCTRGCGRIGARHSLRPLSSEGGIFLERLGRMRREIAEVYLDVIARSEATKQSTLIFLWPYGLLRFARNDDVASPDFAFADRAHRYLRSSRIIAAPFSAIIAVGVLVFPEVIVGITEASATRSPAIP